MESGPAKKSVVVPILIGCGAVALLAGVVIIGFVIWIASQPEGGVKMANEMDEYALEYIEKHKLLDDTEQLIAYYDATISLNGSEAAILTTERVIYHKAGRTTSIALAEIEDVQHHQEALIGDIIEVKGRSAERIKIEIAPLNQGRSFYEALVDAWRAGGGGPRTSFD